MCNCNGACSGSQNQQTKMTTIRNGPTPNADQLAAAMNIFRTVQAGNPGALRGVLNAQGFPTQGTGDQGLADYAYRVFADGSFDINSLNGVQLPNANNRSLGEWIESGAAAFNCLINGDCSNNTPAPPPPDNTDLILGMQKSTMYMIGGIAVIVIALVIFLYARKK